MKKMVYVVISIVVSFAALAGVYYNMPEQDDGRYDYNYTFR